MKLTYFIILITCIGMSLSCKEKTNTPVIEVISVAEMEEVLRADQVQLIDVRTQKEYAEHHIKNAKNIVYQGEDWEAQVAKLDKSKPVYVYCAKGGRSAKCSALLEEAGFEKVYDLDGGITQWINEGKAVE